MIRQQSHLAIVISMFFLAFAGVTAVWAHLANRAATAQLVRLSSLESDILAMKDIAGEYDPRFQQRFLRQWLASETAALDALSEWPGENLLGVGGKSEAMLRLDHMGEYFDRLLDVGNTPDKQPGIESQFRGRINSNADAIIGRLDTIARTMHAKQEVASIGVFASVLACIAIAAVNITLFYGLIIRPILAAFDDLKSEANRIGAGDLGSPVPRPMKGEVAELFGAVDQMRSALLDLTQDLQEKRREAEAASRARSDFLANMSHELRTPLNAVIGYADLLQDYGIAGAEKQKSYASAIGGSGRHLLSLINDVLDFAKIDAGKLTINKEMFDFRGEIENLHSAFRESALANGVELEVDTRNCPVLIESDQMRVRQILYNLVGNAVKFTSDGHVRVTVTTAPLAGRSRNLTICVEDEGIGIDCERVKAIFDPFDQADTSISRRFGGTGLGLPITKQIVEALGGEITVESVPGKGSAFICTFPVDDYSDIAEAARQKDVDRRVSTAHNYGFHILLVDDVTLNREVAGELLKHFGCTFDTAQDGAEAVERVSVTAYDFILMDVHMPGMDGTAATKEIRAMEKASDMPRKIFAWTADVLQRNSPDFARVGWSGCVLKPVSNEGLEAVLSAHARDREADEKILHLKFDGAHSGQRL